MTCRGVTLLLSALSCLTLPPPRAAHKSMPPGPHREATEHLPSGRPSALGPERVTGVDETAGRLHAVPGLRGPQIVKRAVDVFLSSVLILLASPVCLVLLLLVTISVSGTPIYRQSRRGRGGRTFTILKFRTLAGPLADIDRPHSEHAFKFTNGDATTRLGRALRRSSLDELPQLVNVLLGDMSLVGPRPFSAPVYTRPDLAGPDRDRWMEIRESVSPGMTGLWQINGRGDLTAAELIRLDLKYVEEWSLWTDLVILLRTLPAVVTMRGAY